MTKRQLQTVLRAIRGDIVSARYNPGWWSAVVGDALKEHDGTNFDIGRALIELINGAHYIGYHIGVEDTAEKVRKTVDTLQSK